MMTAVTVEDDPAGVAFEQFTGGAGDERGPAGPGGVQVLGRLP